MLSISDSGRNAVAALVGLVEDVVGVDGGDVDAPDRGGLVIDMAVVVDADEPPEPVDDVDEGDAGKSGRSVCVLELVRPVHSVSVVPVHKYIGKAMKIEFMIYLRTFRVEDRSTSCPFPSSIKVPLPV